MIAIKPVEYCLGPPHAVKIALAFAVVDSTEGVPEGVLCYLAQIL